MNNGTRRDPTATNLQSCYCLSVRRRRCVFTTAITCSTTYVIVLMSVINTLLTAAASIPSPCPTPAGSTTVSYIESNHDYDWSYCSLPTGTVWTIAWKFVQSESYFGNVTILVVSGTLLPFIDLTLVGSTLVTITNVSIHVLDYVQTSTSPAVSHSFVGLPLSCNNVTIVLRGCRFAVAGQTPSSFIGQLLWYSSRSSMQATNLHIAFQLCTIHAELSRSRSLLALSPANNSNGISLVVEDSTIGITTTDVDVNAFQISSSNQDCTSFSSNTLLSNIVFRLQRSNITFTQDCTDPSSLCGNGTKPNGEEGKQKSDCALVSWDAQNGAIHHAELLVEDTAFQSNLLLLPFSDAGTGISRSMTLFTVSGSNGCPCFLSHMSVSVSNVTASIVTGKAATLLYFRNVGELSDAVVVVKDSEIALTANGTLSMLETTRSVAVIQIDTKTVGPNVTIRVSRVVSHLSALSGERLPAASSSLIITSAALLYCSASIDTTVVLVSNCGTVTEISKGYLPLFHVDNHKVLIPDEMIPQMAFYNMLSTLLVFDRQCNVTSVHTSIVNCFLTSSSGLTMGTASPRALVSAAVISATTLMTMATNCTLSTFVIQGCSVNVTSLFFPKMFTQLNTEAFHQQVGGLSTTSGFVLLNITALFMGFDTISLFQISLDKATDTLPGFASYIRQELPADIKDLMTPIIYDAVNVSIENSSVFLSLSFYDFKRSDVVSFLLTPTLATNTVIHLSGSMQVTQTNTLPVAAISMLRSAVETSIVRVNGLIDAGPMIVALVGRSYISPSTSFVFTNNSFRTRNGAIRAVGVNTSLSVMSTVTATAHAIFDITDNTFFSGGTGDGRSSFEIFNRSNVYWKPGAPSSGKNTAVLHLGCNLIDNAPLLTSNIGVPSSLLWSIVDFPAGYFHGVEDLLTLSAPESLPWCTGLSSTRTTPIPPPPVEQHPSDSSGTTYGATRIAGGVVCVSYALPQLAVSLSSLQRSLQAVSLARRCTATGAADAPDDFMADWMSNPLQMHFSSADDGLGWAAGSVVGNVLLIVCLTLQL